MTVKEYLSQIYYIRLKIERLQDRRDNIRERMIGLSSPGLSDRVQTSPEDKMARLMTKLDGLDRKIAQQIEKEQRLVEQIQSQIDQLPAPKQRELLSLYYVSGLKWEEVADRMKYTEPRIYQLRKEALAAFTELYKDYI